ncbi:hypothetical protein [Dinghuibacter silviterrae]|uniref:CCDC81-like prokaryotic HU domain-containing protein n=1 Tax=Dinghuibacter silviterrae TaxID=1539049 RepID=A0A4R8DTD2_9BACT|nr:hypothetical protein [Dinghuibacter silviterrae]TDX01168.1 hypothetical protein EDB95_2199 [Dinghuibacter silviterrae]
MKISDLLSQYLYQNKELVLEGFGVFHLDPSVNVQDAKEPQQVYQGITFDNNNKLKSPPELIDFLVQHSGKMKPLAISDLEAFLTTGRELLNLGKPLILNGIGTLTGIRQTNLEFTPGPFIPVRLEREGQFKERVATSEEELFHAEDVPGAPGSSTNGRRLMLIIAGVLVLLLAGWGLYHIAFQHKAGTGTDTTGQIQPVEGEAPAAHKDTTTTSDTTAKAPVTAPAAAPVAPAVNGPVTFRVLIRTYSEAGRAHRRLDSLIKWGHKVVLESRDSTHFAILMPFTLPLSDTTRVRDSLADFFGSRVRIVPAH